jgi:8-oxo-dGTP diphosphatase
MPKFGSYGICVKAVVFNKNKVLILKRTDYQDEYSYEWDLPGGKLHEGEEPKPALMREVREETNTKIIIKHPFDCVYFNSRLKKHNLSIVYLTKYVSGKLKSSHEHEFVKWYSVDKLPKDLTPWVKSTIKKAKKFL